MCHTCIYVGKKSPSHGSACYLTSVNIWVEGRMVGGRGPEKAVQGRSCKEGGAQTGQVEVCGEEK